MLNFGCIFSFYLRFFCYNGEFITCSALRKTQGRQEEILYDTIPSKEKDPAEVVLLEEDEQIDEMRYIPEVMENLSNEQRELYDRYYVNHEPMKDIAAALGLKEPTLRMRYVRLRKDVRRIISEIDFQKCEGGCYDRKY